MGDSNVVDKEEMTFGQGDEDPWEWVGEHQSRDKDSSMHGG